MTHSNRTPHRSGRWLRPASGGALAIALDLVHATAALAARRDIRPNASIPGTDALARIAGGFMTVGLIAATLGLLISLAGVGLAGHAHNIHLRDRFKTGVFLSLLGTCGFGAANRILDWAYSIGTGI